jgi:hypothetical protein
VTYTTYHVYVCLKDFMCLTGSICKLLLGSHASKLRSYLIPFILDSLEPDTRSYYVPPINSSTTLFCRIGTVYPGTSWQFWHRVHVKNNLTTGTCTHDMYTCNIRISNCEFKASFSFKFLHVLFYFTVNFVSLVLYID